MAEYRTGPFFIREGKWMETGEEVETHAHEEEHVTYFSHGRWLAMMLDGPEGKVVQKVEKSAEQGKNWVTVKAGTWHRFRCLEAGRYNCHFAHRSPDGTVVREYDGWEQGYA